MAHPHATLASQLGLALELAAHGWHILPLSPASKRPLANCPRCRTNGRPHPIETCPCLPADGWCHGVRAATTDADRLTAWWHRQPHAVPGIGAGPSRLLLIDLDAHSSTPPADPAALLPDIDLNTEPRHLPCDLSTVRTGMDVLSLLARARGGPRPWPTDPDHQPITVHTPSGGRHLWYRAPAAPVRQALGELGWQIDIKAGWNYGIAPGATTPAGTYTKRSGDITAPGHMPPWLAREVTRVASTSPARSRRHPYPPPPRDRLEEAPARYLATVIDRGTARLTSLADGRQRALSALAYQAGGLLAWSGVPEHQVIAWLVSAGETSGLPTRLATRIVHRAIAQGARSPLTPRPRSAA
ncbi:bifunctional DNA primase/polymerase [Nonomuraea dietziae]|uniref:bifunctional DNA primase/polymerase n=1 Tax=Nonomuraea dietziae TaxID=65515 RepID=UPI003446F11D